jgi:MFS family permease
LLVIATAQLMVVLDGTIVNVALPNIQRALGFSGSGLEWVVNAYAVTFGGLLLLGGRAGDILGRRRVFVFGLLLFSAASLLGGFATSQWWLLTARAVQGVGGAVIAPTALALITTNFPEGGERNRAFGVYSAMAGGGSAMGLLLGGVLTTYASWRWVLFVNVPIGIVVAAAARRVLAESPRRPGRIDVAGAITGTGGVALLVYSVGHAVGGGDLVDGPPQVLADRGRSVEQHDAVCGGQERRLVDAVGDPIQVPLHPAHEVALLIEGRAERGPGNRRVLRQGCGSASGGGW